MKETCKQIEELKEVLREFMHIQIGINDDVDNEFDNMARSISDKITELDHDTTYVLKDLLKRIIILEEKVKHYESQNVREDINKINDKMIRINKKHTTEINDVQHRLNIIEKEKRRNASNK